MFFCSPSDLRAFSAIIAEHEDSILDTEKLVNTMRTQMTTILANVTRNFFDGNDIENKLVTLEVLKAKFAPYEGKDWSVDNQKYSLQLLDFISTLGIV